MNFPAPLWLNEAPTTEQAVAALERVRLKAAVNLEVLSETLTMRGVDPTSSFKAILDAAEFNYKLSGLAAKQQAPAAGAGFSLTINLGGTPQHPTLTVTAEPPETDLLAAPPAYLNLIPMTSDLQVDFD